MKTLVVIPTYNEIESLPHTLDRLFEWTPRADVLIVDDGSPDGTGEYADSRAEEDPRIHVLHNTRKGGLGAAYLAGFRWALEGDWEIICEMDADGSHRGRDLPLLLRAVEDGADLAIGSRWVPGGAIVNWPLRRHLLSRAANVYANAAIGMGVADATAGFRAFRRTTLEALDLTGVQSAGYCFQIDMTRRVLAAGLTIAEVPTAFIERELGSSKMDGDIITEALTQVARWGAQRRLQQVRELLGRRRTPAHSGR
ncbi:MULTISPECIES: polyprenol monophosphomannose synthase [Brevibacterium]|uniref:Polyprenol monophosphomannose synthase n=1 Tax=Brevibacterium salitolerans TaxID=1403566 RepID=A0ABP5IX97_9MICO|nr:polyprenol monophosphomannose synthase [Brevibacterium sp.]